MVRRVVERRHMRNGHVVEFTVDAPRQTDEIFMAHGLAPEEGRRHWTRRRLMVEALPEGGSVVVTATPSANRIVRETIQETRSRRTCDATVVCEVRSPSQAVLEMSGHSVPVYLDLSCYSFQMPKHLASFIHRLAVVNNDRLGVRTPGGDFPENPLQHCDHGSDEVEANNMPVDFRNFVMSLPESGSVVVVHTADLRADLQEMILDLRGVSMLQVTRVRSIRDMGTAQRVLTGVRVPVLFHPAYDRSNVSSSVRNYVHGLAYGTNTMHQTTSQLPLGEDQ